MAYITYLEDQKIFSLRTIDSMYQMKVARHGYLLHLYYGKPVGDTDTSYRIIGMDRGFSGNPDGEDPKDRTFSLDVLPQEYAGFGNGDYRTSAVEVRHADGSNVMDLQYESHKIYDGKYGLEGLPAVFADKKDSQTLEIVLKDSATDVKVVLYYGVVYSKNVITRAAKIINGGKNEITVRRAMSMQVDFLDSEMDLIHFYGRHTMERQTERTALHHGNQSIGSLRGASSHHHNPFLILCDRNADENQGNCYGVSLLYSGNFLGEIEVDQVDQARMILGIHPSDFEYRLAAGETFTAPEVMMTYSASGIAKLSHMIHDALRENLIRGKYTKVRRPVLVNNWEATYFQFNEEKLYRIAEQAKEIGIEMLVMDDGWFGKREDDYRGLGDWTVNTEKLKGGLPALVEKVNALGLKFGIWVEPEMISEDSDLYRNHPDWCLKIPGRGANRSRCQLNLDISRKEVRDYIMDSLFEVLDSCNIEYVKWDMNRSVSNVYSMNLSAEHQGEVLHRYVLGVYDMMERLITRYPDLLFESCAGGGGRFDAGMLYYSPQVWCSDNTDAVERLKIQYGTSFGYPVSTVGSHVSASPNHQTGRETSFGARGTVAMAGTFGYELDLEHLSEEEKRMAGEQINEYKELAPLVLNGDYYRLSDPFDGGNYVMWEFVSKEQDKAAVMGLQVRPESNQKVQLLKIKGLKEEANYYISGLERTCTGAALMYAGVPLPILKGDYQPVRYDLTEV